MSQTFSDFYIFYFYILKYVKSTPSSKLSFLPGVNEQYTPHE